MRDPHKDIADLAVFTVGMILMGAIATALIWAIVMR